jgi:arsenite methyltransferase
MDMRAKMFNRRASEGKSMPDTVIQSLELGPGQVIADIGSGGGYFSLRFAQIVGKTGKVYAVDVDPKLLDYVRRQGEAKGLLSLRAVPGNGFPASIPPGSLNLVFMRNVYHHLDDPASYFADLKKYLRPEGKVAIIDYKDDAKGFSFHSLFKHSVSPAKVKRDMAEAGYGLERSFDFLPEEYFLVFKPPI